MVFSRFRTKNNWPAEIWIIKPFKNRPEISKTRGRRIDEKEDRNDITSQETRFELKAGGTTAPVPYNQIYQTNGSPLVILLSPEKGTYVPAELHLNDNERKKAQVERLEKEKERVEKTLEKKEDLEDEQIEKLEESQEQLESALEKVEDQTTIETKLDMALDNQEWLRWGKQMVTDMKLSWEEDKGWWGKHGEKVVLIMAVFAVITGTIMNYLGMNNMGEAISKLAEQSKNFIPIMAFQFRNKLRGR